MELFPRELRAQLALNCQVNHDDPIAYAKFFTPLSYWLWYVTEGAEHAPASVDPPTARPVPPDGVPIVPALRYVCPAASAPAESFSGAKAPGILQHAARSATGWENGWGVKTSAAACTCHAPSQAPGKVCGCPRKAGSGREACQQLART